MRDVPTVDPYSRGDYFSDARRHAKDARFKADAYLKVFLKFVKQNNLAISSFVGSIRVSQRYFQAFWGFSWVISWERPCGSSWKTRSVFQGAVGAFCASTAPSASTGPVRGRQDGSQGGEPGVMSNWTAASSDCGRDDVHIRTADLYRPNARFTPERQRYQVLTPFGKLGYSPFVDVGCGSGDIIKIIADSLNVDNSPLITFKAYDVSPHLQNIKLEGVEYIYGDFCESDEFVDVVTSWTIRCHRARCSRHD